MITLVLTSNYITSEQPLIFFTCYHGILDFLGENKLLHTCILKNAREDLSGVLADKRNTRLLEYALEFPHIVDNLRDIPESDIIIIPVAMGMDKVRTNVLDLAKLHPHSVFWFLWQDCLESLELEMNSLIREADLYRRCLNFTHWGVKTTCNQLVTDFPYSSRLELPEFSSGHYDFGFNGCFYYSKNHKYLEYALKFTDKPISILGASDKNLVEFPKLRKLVSDNKLAVQGVHYDWESAYSIMNRSWIHINSQKPRHRKFGSFVRRVTMVSEAGSLLLLNKDDSISVDEVFPEIFINSPEYIKEFLLLPDSQKREIISQQRNFIRKRFDVTPRVHKALEWSVSRTFPEFHSFRSVKHKRI